MERGFADQMDLILKECYSGEPQHVSDILDLWACGHAYNATAILGGDVMLCTYARAYVMYVQCVCGSEHGISVLFDATCPLISPPHSIASCKPQTLLFSATVPLWVQRTARKYMDKERVLVDLIGQQKMRTAVTVQVRTYSMLHLH